MRKRISSFLCSISALYLTFSQKKKNQTGQPTMSLLLVCPLLFLLPPGQLSHSSHQNANLRGREGLLLCHLQALQSIDPPSHVSRCFKVSLRSKLFCTLFSSFKKKKRMWRAYPQWVQREVMCKSVHQLPEHSAGCGSGLPWARPGW